MIELFKGRKNDLHDIANEYYKRLTTPSNNQRKSLIHYLDDAIESNIGITKVFFKTYKEDLENVILAKPNDLWEWAKSIETYNLNLREIKTFFSDQKVGYYSYYDRWGAYELAKKLKVEVCPYCNRNYTFTLGEDKANAKGTRPEYDHFFCKSKYPYLAFSFYNLIPSCHICNSNLKGKEEFELIKNIHPYSEGFGENAKFTSKPKTYDALLGLDDENLEIKLDVKSFDTDLKQKIEGNIKTFKLNELYAKHGSSVSELYMKKQISNDQYLTILQSTFADLKLSRAEIYRLAFGNFMNEDDFGKRPLSKLTHDIAQELGLID